MLFSPTIGAACFSAYLCCFALAAETRVHRRAEYSAPDQNPFAPAGFLRARIRRRRPLGYGQPIEPIFFAFRLKAPGCFFWDCAFGG
jgi:hypothetical protein